MVDRTRLELVLPECKSGVPPTTLTAHLSWSEWQDSNLRHPAPKAGGMNQTILHSVYFGGQSSTRSYTVILMKDALSLLRYLTNVWCRLLESNQVLEFFRLVLNDHTSSSGKLFGVFNEYRPRTYSFTESNATTTP